MDLSLHKELKKDPEKMQELLRPEKHIGEIDPFHLDVKVLQSGFPSLDNLLFLKDQRSELIIIGGRPSMGKSAFMFQLAFNVSHSHPVHIFSLEMDREQLLTRHIAGECGRSITHIQKGLVPAGDLAKAHKKLSKLQYWVDDRAGISVNALCNAAIDTHKRIGTRLVVVDYLQMLHVARGHSKDDEVGTVTRQLKELAKELRCPVVVGSQLNRACETRGKSSGDYRPMLADLRESGNIEQDADIVMFVHRQSRYTGERPGEADLIIAKNRNGDCREIAMNFSAQHTTFIDKYREEV